MTETQWVQESIDRLQAMRQEIERQLQAAKAETVIQAEAMKQAATTKNGS